MTLFGFSLLLIAAWLHVFWNLLLKRMEGSVVILWLGFTLGSTPFLPLLLFHLPIPARVWPLILASSLFEAVYLVALSGAYQRDDFTLVYPIARGAAPGLLAVWSVLFLKEMPTLAGFGGLALIILGLIIVGSSKLWETGWRSGRDRSGLALAGLVSVTISGYTVIDGAAVKWMDALSYTILVTFLAALLAAPFLLKRIGWRQMQHEFQRHWRISGLIGVIMLVTYTLVLYVYHFSVVAYAGAIREVSIVFGALAGWLWLKEKLGAVRIVGALVIFCGIVVILLAG